MLTLLQIGETIILYLYNNGASDESFVHRHSDRFCIRFIHHWNLQTKLALVFQRIYRNQAPQGRTMGAMFLGDLIIWADTLSKFIFSVMIQSFVIPKIKLLRRYFYYFNFWLTIQRRVALIWTAHKQRCKQN